MNTVVYDRASIKSEAKVIVKENLKNLIPILLVIGVIAGAASGLINGLHLSKIANSIMTTLVSAAISLPLSIGLCGVFLKIYRKEKFALKDIFNYFPNLLNIILLGVVTAIIISAGVFLIIIPGIYFSLRLSQVNYIMADSDTNDITFMEAIKKSWTIMQGRCGQLFVLIFSFLPWGLLGGLFAFLALIIAVLSVDISLLITIPLVLFFGAAAVVTIFFTALYINAAQANFYLKIK